MEVELLPSSQCVVDDSPSIDSSSDEIEDQSETTLIPEKESTIPSAVEVVPPQETPKQDYALWAWPLNEDGFVRAYSRKDKFSVALDFKYLLAKDAQIRKFDTSKAGGQSFTFSIGLCSIKRADLSFWRLEIHIFAFTDLILIEAFREVFQDYSCIESVRKQKKLRKLRRTYRLPSDYDITTAKVTINEIIGAIVIEASPKQAR